MKANLPATISLINSLDETWPARLFTNSHLTCSLIEFSRSQFDSSRTFSRITHTLGKLLNRFVFLVRQSILKGILLRGKFDL